MNDKKFLNIPVPMLKYLHTNSKKFFNDVFDVGIFLYSKTLSGNEIKRFKDSAKFFHVILKGIDGSLMNSKRILNNLPDRYPVTGIEINMLWDYYKNEKSDFDIACLGAFLAVKSILGTKPYCKTNKALIHARMFGYSTVKELPLKLSGTEKKYQVRWHMDKILYELQENWFLKVFSDHQRGMYVSFDLSLTDLALKSEASKQKTKIQLFKEAKKKAIEEAKSQLTTH